MEEADQENYADKQDQRRGGPQGKIEDALIKVVDLGDEVGPTQQQAVEVDAGHGKEKAQHGKDPRHREHGDDVHAIALQPGFFDDSCANGSFRGGEGEDQQNNRQQHQAECDRKGDF